MVNQTPDDFRFGLKVTDALTIKKFPKLDRFGEQAGKPNPNFLNADLFVKAFEPYEPGGAGRRPDADSRGQGKPGR
jgi:hypothetical protein